MEQPLSNRDDSFKNLRNSKEQQNAFKRWLLSQFHKSAPNYTIRNESVISAFTLHLADKMSKMNPSPPRADFEVSEIDDDNYRVTVDFYYQAEIINTTYYIASFNQQGELDRIHPTHSMQE